MIDPPVTVVLRHAGAQQSEIEDSVESIVDLDTPLQLVLVGFDRVGEEAITETGPWPHPIEVRRATDGLDAFGQARGAVVLPLRAGDVLLPQALPLADAALRHGAEVVYGEPLAIDADGCMAPVQPSAIPYRPADFLVDPASVPQSGAIVSRDAVDRVVRAVGADGAVGPELWMRLVLTSRPVRLAVPLAALRWRAPSRDALEERRAACRGIEGWLVRERRGLRLRAAAAAARHLVWLDDPETTRARRAGHALLAVARHPAAAKVLRRRRTTPQPITRNGLSGPGETGWDLAGVGSFDPQAAVPPRDEGVLSPGNPQLVDLRRRYEALGAPLCTHSFWAEEYRNRDLDLRHFRGDNAFVWQQRHLRGHAARTYELYARHLSRLDERGWLRSLEEDGAFGCWTFASADGRTVSRDLLDSVNELYLIDRVWGIIDQPGLTVLDIGAGYGRLAHRMDAAVEHLGGYYCVDGVPESTFLSEHYLRFRNARRAVVVPADRLDRLRGCRIDLAVNLHSFSEMAHATIDAWLRLLVELDVPRLLIVPNDPDDLLSYEVDHTRRDFSDLLSAHGFQLCARGPLVGPRYLRDLLSARDTFSCYERAEISA